MDEILILVKNLPEYQRTKIDALKPTVKKKFQVIKKEKEKELISDNNKEINNNSKSFLNKKRNLPSNKMSIIPISNSFNPEKFLYKSSIKLSSLGGMTEIVKKITEIISNPLYYYQAYKEINTLPIKRILLCGPPGCGKTTLAYSIGGEFQITFYIVMMPKYLLNIINILALKKLLNQPLLKVDLQVKLVLFGILKDQVNHSAWYSMLVT